MNLDVTAHLPASIVADTESGPVALLPQPGGLYANGSLELRLTQSAVGTSVMLTAPNHRIKALHLRWNADLSGNVRVVSDAWERGYGDMAWLPVDPDRTLPWTFAVHEEGETICVGVAVRPAAMCWWQVGKDHVGLCLDVRSGNRGVQLGTRVLDVATIQMGKSNPGESAFKAQCRFYKTLCKDPITPPEALYGFNDFYYTYSKNTQDMLLHDSDFLAEVTPANGTRPFHVVDCGWQLGGGVEGGPWDRGNRFFPDMPGLARKIKERGQRPGLWSRLLVTHERMPEHWYRTTYNLDPSVPEVLAMIEQDMRRFTTEWGYELVKHDFSTIDIFSKWGKDMHRDPIGTDKKTFANGGKTSAEIVIDFYRAIKRGAGKAYVLGCNTIGHLSAGLVEIARTGDDTSGEGWHQVVKHGVNTIAFKMPHQGAFCAADADCVGIHAIPWTKNKQWLEMLTVSGTPVFVSAAPAGFDKHATGPEETAAIKDAFARASVPRPVAEPLDWMETNRPRRWSTVDGPREFDWTV